MNKPEDALQNYQHEILAKLNEALRKEGFSEDQIAKIDTVVRRALDLL
jgi:anti-sigma regulatory factor (Ser/Thr protein kinase)